MVDDLERALALVPKLEGLLEKATAGPWGLLAKDGNKPRVIFATDDDLRYIARFKDGPCFHSPTPDDANAELVMEAVNVLPTLLSALRTVEEERWQDMASAPLDETSVDLWIEAEKFGWRVPGVWWHPDDEVWWDPHANYGEGGPIHLGPLDKIVAWRPLPSAPVSSLGEGE